MKIDKVRWESTTNGNGVTMYTVTANVKEWGSRSNGFYFNWMNTYTKLNVEFSAVFISEVVNGYGPSSPTQGHRNSYGIVGGKEERQSRLSYGGYYDYTVGGGWDPMQYLGTHKYTLNSEISGYSFRYRFVSSSLNKEYRCNSEFGLELQSRINKIYSPLYLQTLLAKYKIEKKQLEDKS